MILRLLYKKKGFVRFNAHLDMVRIFERSLRRSSVDLTFSQGFNPHPKISFASPLSVGISSDYEIVDVDINSTVCVVSFRERSRKCFPHGIEITAAKLLEKSRAPMSMITGASYLLDMSMENGFELNSEHIDNFLKQEKIEFLRLSRKGKSSEPKLIDIRPHIFSLELIKSGQNPTLKMAVAQGSEFNLKPDTVAEKLSLHAGGRIAENSVRINRLCMWGEDSSGNTVNLYDLT